VFLANCQLMTSWLPKLEKIVQTLEKSNPNPDFRLWLSSVPNDKFPIGILQRSVKMTAEPPKVRKRVGETFFTPPNILVLTSCNYVIFTEFMYQILS